jgi:hypothetical protein
MSAVRKWAPQGAVSEVESPALREAGELAGGLDDQHLHARRLQQHLQATYADVPAGEKLPFAQRALVIAGLTTILWSIIGGLIYLVA